MKVKTFLLKFGLVLISFCATAGAESLDTNSGVFHSAARNFLEAKNKVGAAVDAVENATARFLSFKGDKLLKKHSGYGEFEFRLDEGKPEYNLIILNGLEVGSGEEGTFFNQFGLNRFDGRSTINFGLGYRHLLNENKLLLGINAFYDHELPYDHNRASVGVELTTSILSGNMNIYEALSGYRPDRDANEARALDGWDANVFLAVPYIKSSSLRFNHFNWNAIDGAVDLEGSSLSLIARLGLGLNFEAGRVFYESDVTKDDEYFAKVGFSMSLGERYIDDKEMFFEISSIPYELTDISSHRLLPVKRENRIIKQNKFSVSVSGF